MRGRLRERQNVLQRNMSARRRSAREKQSKGDRGGKRKCKRESQEGRNTEESKSARVLFCTKEMMRNRQNTSPGGK